jgi:hypothetical protein
MATLAHHTAPNKNQLHRPPRLPPMHEASQPSHEPLLLNTSPSRAAMVSTRSSGASASSASASSTSTSSSSLPALTFTPVASIAPAVAAARAAFDSGKTRPLAWRRAQLHAIKKLVEENTDRIVEALRRDLRRPELEGVVAEVRVVVGGGERKPCVAHVQARRCGCAGPRRARESALVAPSSTFPPWTSPARHIPPHPLPFPPPPPSPSCSATPSSLR